MRGRALAAVSIVNGTLSGTGCSLAVEGGVEAAWRWTHTGAVQVHGAPDDRVATAVRDVLRPRAGASAVSTSTFPPSRGLKTSSSAAAALVRAAQPGIADEEVVAKAVAACRLAGVTLTGAGDDQWAVTTGGCHVVDNRADLHRKRIKVPPWHVAVWVPDHAVPKDLVAPIDPAPAADAARAALALAEAGRVPEAMQLAGDASLALYQAAGLPVSAEPGRAALGAGALAASLSGTGPAWAALFDDGALLPKVAGGRWHWTQVRP